ncbi:polyribonucleotide nucleotidyltransferase [Candidatus Microgenomates bacterium]|nr:polyribonucleotide nucleotidyltransferase [Candidatus Microgenomates bacterium]
MLKKTIKKELEVSGKTISFEINKLAPQANVSVIAKCGDTEVLVTVVSGASKNLGYFPLTVDFVERLYAGGIIKGSRWVKREGRPTDESILTGRLIDRSVRPLFPKDFMDEVQVIVTLLSTDGENDHDVLSILAVSLALHVSNIPWNGPVAAVRAGYIAKDEAGVIINPQISEMAFSDLDLVISGNKDGVVMLEAGAKQLPIERALIAIEKSLPEISKLVEFFDDLRKEVGQEKYTYDVKTLNQDLISEIDKNYWKELEPFVFTNDPNNKPHTEKIDELKTTITEKYAENPDKGQIGEIVDLIVKKHIRKSILETKKRSDGRKPGEVRDVSGEVGLLPRTHGSAVFQRGLTQIMSVVTLANPSLEQWIETAEGMEEKRYLHHYNCPPYAMGETGRMGSTGRREIGHSALAERALFPVVPTQEKFPYTIRVVSEVLSENGSSSMGSACGSTMAMMDAGVPLLAPVSGVAMGIIAEDKDNYVVLTDIAAFEDFYGNMDFKIAGSENGITAVQLDIKMNEGFHGLTFKMIKDTFAQNQEARAFILEKMLAVIPENRKTVSQYAPKVVTIKVPVEKIGEVIGPGGKNIRNIIATTGAEVNIDDDGTVTISAIDADSVEKARAWIDGTTRELVIGEEFEGEVKRILPFGAFVEVLPGKEGLVHVSRMTAGYVGNPEEVVQIGQKVKVKVMEIDEMGRLNLAMYWGPKDQTQAQPGAPFGGVRTSRPPQRRNRY